MKYLLAACICLLAFGCVDNKYVNKRDLLYNLTEGFIQNHELLNKIVFKNLDSANYYYGKESAYLEMIQKVNKNNDPHDP